MVCNYELTPTHETSLALPSATAAAIVSPALFASASVVIASAIALVIHFVSLLQVHLFLHQGGELGGFSWLWLLSIPKRLT
jgi:hypothetical protein